MKLSVAAAIEGVFLLVAEGAVAYAAWWRSPLAVGLVFSVTFAVIVAAVSSFQQEEGDHDE